MTDEWIETTSGADPMDATRGIIGLTATHEHLARVANRWIRAADRDAERASIEAEAERRLKGDPKLRWAMLYLCETRGWMSPDGTLSPL